MSTTPAEPYDGRHLIADLHGCSGRLDDIALIEGALREAARAAGAAVLEVRLHGFGAGNGVTGMALLAESHISIHSWPEHGYAAVDIFLCGARHDPALGLEAITGVLRPARTDIKTVHRGYRGVQSSA